MKKEIVINASKDRSRIAIVENGELVELYVENPDNVRTIGNVYLGRVQKVMPAIRAAFVDVGQKQDCFLHFSDLTDNLPQLLALAGEEVPGLDEPVLSLAPSKRVADDEDEPDVEDALEVESGGDEEEDDKDKPRRSRRRSRGRGRGRGRGRRGKGRREEEEEEEERRPLPSVLDLTSGSKPRSKPKSRRAPEPEPADDSADDTPEADAPKTDDEPKPKARRKTRSPKEAKAEAPDAEAPAADPADDESSDEAPKNRRSRKGRSDRDGQSKDDAPTEEPTAQDEAAGDQAEADDAESGDDDSSGGKRSRRRRRRGGRGRGRSKASDDSGADDSNSDDDQEGRKDSRAKSRGKSKKTADEKVDDKNVDDGQDPSPKGKVSPTGRSRRPADPVQNLEEKVEDDESGRKPLPATLDLTGGSRPSRSARSASDDESDDSTGRSRRRTRSGSSEDQGQDESSKSDQKTDTDSDSRRRSRSKKSDDEPSKGGSSRGRSGDNGQTSEDDSEGGGRRRTRGGRSKSDAPKSDSQTSESKKDESSKGRDRSPRGGRNDRNDRNDKGGRGRSTSSKSKSNVPIPPNEELLKRNGRVIVKITKEAISTKGPRVSTDLSLAGRFLVLVPAADYVAVSKKIESAKERRRLRTLASSLKPDRFGVIVRTVAEGRDAKSLDQDLKLLIDKWRKIQDKLDEQPEPPVLLYQDVNMVSSVIRDLFSEDYDRILVDDPKVFRNVQAYIKAVAPSMANKVELHEGRSPVFRSLGIEKQVEEAFSKRVNMKGGGYLFIETTEAMHVVDVNSGRAGRGKSQKQNLIDVNVEAAKEVAKQLRLRDLGGIIVVDFIDLKYDRDRKKVTDALKEAFKRDRAVTKLLPMSDFGLVQITRQRLRPSITTQATDEDGEPLDAAEAAAAAGAGEIVRKGQVPVAEAEPQVDRSPERSQPAPERPSVAPEDATPRALSGRLRGWLDHYRQTVDERYKRRPIAVKVHPLFGAYLRRGFPSPLTRWRLALRGITFVLEEDAAVDPLAFDVRDQKSGRSLLKKYSA
ncbi:Rne/Rng family ribonuclease [Rubrivirga marina]|uniref:RNA-binding protein AU-1/Ribonuclease E/G domain-containing protein n=1 Tax=Rubrivirga marina TaxID=1196024 RepID=A0A271J491_9BACT|nr:Rne/Rng family ribonuclease [Rubrivirga marina]PAP78107.1 hypothetical protein BSZ37_17530 [Rubrivirga marina]